MSRAELAPIASLCLLCAACSSQPLNPGGGGPAEHAVVGEWQEVLAATVPGDITELKIGGEAYDDNFANRGDVIVEFAETDLIRVEMRPFTSALAPELAQDDFDKLKLWAFVAPAISPLRPEEMVVSKPCVQAAGELRDGCALRTFFEGQNQPLRLGADFRVTLPIGFPGKLVIKTEDNDWDENYLDRADVCVGPGARAVDVRMQKGRAILNLDPGGAGGSVDANVIADAAEVTVDIASNAAATMTASYKYDEATQAICDAAFDLEGFVQTGGSPGASGGVIEGAAGPNEGTPAHAFIKNDACEWVQSVESPEEAAALGGEPAPSEVRGNIHFCHDCLGQATCDQLL